MRRPIVIALLALGTIAGYGSGLAHMCAWHHSHCSSCPHHEAPPGER
jgi:hypothetical protein